MAGAALSVGDIVCFGSLKAPTITDEGMRDLSASLAQNRRLMKHAEPAALPPIKTRRAARVRPGVRIA